MTTRMDEIADGIFRISTYVAEVAPPAGFAFNQYLLLGDEPLLFHTGHRRLFPAVLGEVARLIAPERLRWISFGHVEADECGAMNLWLEASPNAEIAHGAIAVDVSVGDLADRPPRRLADGERIDLGGKTVRYIDTPHTPHGWEAGLLLEETTNHPALRRPVHPDRPDGRPDLGRHRRPRRGRRRPVRLLQPPSRNGLDHPAPGGAHPLDPRSDARPRFRRRRRRRSARPGRRLRPPHRVVARAQGGGGMTGGAGTTGAR